jgi:hypothetical protein
MELIKPYFSELSFTLPIEKKRPRLAPGREPSYTRPLAALGERCKWKQSPPRAGVTSAAYALIMVIACTAAWLRHLVEHLVGM